MLNKSFVNCYSDLCDPTVRRVCTTVDGCVTSIVFGAVIIGILKLVRDIGRNKSESETNENVYDADFEVKNGSQSESNDTK